MFDYVNKINKKIAGLDLNIQNITASIKSCEKCGRFDVIVV